MIMHRVLASRETHIPQLVQHLFDGVMPPSVTNSFIRGFREERERESDGK
jgi:hypothetical protein